MTITDTPMWPCEMAPPNDLRVGDVVENTSPSMGEADRRGVVRHIYKPGEKVRSLLPIQAGDAEVYLGPGNHAITNNGHRHWRKVPYAEWTTRERVQSKAFTWRPVTGREDPTRKIIDIIKSIALDFGPEMHHEVKRRLDGALRLAEEWAITGPADDDQIGWHLLTALLPPATYDRITTGWSEWPETLDLALVLADEIDATHASPDATEQG